MFVVVSCTVLRLSTTIDQNVQRRRAIGPISKIHSRKVIQKKLLSDVPAKDHGRAWSEVWEKGNSGDGNCVFRDSRELNEGNKPGNVEDCVAGPECPSEATSTTAYQADEKHRQNTSHG